MTVQTGERPQPIRLKRLPKIKIAMPNQSLFTTSVQTYRFLLLLSVWLLSACFGGGGNNGADDRSGPAPTYSKNYGTEHNEAAGDMVEAKDGQLVQAGFTNDGDGGGYGWLSLLNAAGDPLWWHHKDFGLSTSADWVDGVYLGDGAALLVGDESGSSYSDSDIKVRRLRADGGIDWERSLDGTFALRADLAVSPVSVGNCCPETTMEQYPQLRPLRGGSDGVYVLAQSKAVVQWQGVRVNRNFIVVWRLAPDGSVLWQRALARLSGDTKLSDAAVSPGGDLAVAYWRKGDDDQKGDIELQRLDAATGADRGVSVLLSDVHPDWAYAQIAAVTDRQGLISYRGPGMQRSLLVVDMQQREVTWQLEDGDHDYVFHRLGLGAILDQRVIALVQAASRNMLAIWNGDGGDPVCQRPFDGDVLDVAPTPAGTSARVLFDDPDVPGLQLLTVAADCSVSDPATVETVAGHSGRFDDRLGVEQIFSSTFGRSAGADLRRSTMFGLVHDDSNGHRDFSYVMPRESATGLVAIAASRSGTTAGQTAAVYHNLFEGTSATLVTYDGAGRVGDTVRIDRGNGVNALAYNDVGDLVLAESCTSALIRHANGTTERLHIEDGLDGGCLFGTGELSVAHDGAVWSRDTHNLLWRLDSAGRLQRFRLVLTGEPEIFESPFTFLPATADSLSFLPNGGVVLADAVTDVDNFVSCTGRNGECFWRRRIPVYPEAFNARLRLHSAVGAGDGGVAVLLMITMTGAGEQGIRNTPELVNDTDIALLKLDANGNPRWMRVFGGAYNEEPRKLLALSDGGFAIQAVSDSLDALSPASRDVWVLRTGPDGHVGLDQVGVEHCAMCLGSVADERLLKLVSVATPPWLDTPEDIPVQRSAASMIPIERVTLEPFVGTTNARQCSGTATDSQEAAFALESDDTPTAFNVKVSLVEINLSRGNRVTSDPAGIDCRSGPTGVCNFDFPLATPVRLYAHPGNGEIFEKWSGCDSVEPAAETGLPPICRLDGSGPDRFGARPKAYFKADLSGSRVLDIHVIGTGSGHVTSSPGNIDCRQGGSSICTWTYPSGTGVTLNALAETGSRFVGWHGDCAANTGGVTTPTLVLLLTHDTSCSAEFAPIAGSDQGQISIRFEGSGDGEVIGVNVSNIACFKSRPAENCQAEFPLGSEVQLDVIAFTPGRVERVEGCTSYDSARGRCVVQIRGQHPIVVRLEAPEPPPQESVTLRIELNQEDFARGFVTATDTALMCGVNTSVCAIVVSRGTTLSLFAQALDGFEFDSWGGQCSDASAQWNIAVTMDRDKTCSVHFRPRQHTVSVSFNLPDGSAAITSTPFGIACQMGDPGSACAAVFEHGTAVELRAISFAEPMLHFVDWGGDCAGFGNLSFGELTVDRDLHCEARFTLTGMGRIAVQFAGTGAGRVFTEDGTINCHSSNPQTQCSFDYPLRSVQTLRFVADAPATLTRVTGCVLEQGDRCQITVVGWHQPVATFSP